MENYARPLETAAAILRRRRRRTRRAYAALDRLLAALRAAAPERKPAEA